MMAIATNRKQRLRTLENHIRKCAEQIQKNGIDIGRDLIEIRDEELWRESHESWEQYLKDRAESLVGKSFARAAKLVEAKEMHDKLPSSFAGERDLGAEHMLELRRLAPETSRPSGGTAKDVSRLRKADVTRVLKQAKRIAVESKGEDAAIGKRDIRQAVDEDLGINRTAKAAQTRERQAQQNGVDLHDYLTQKLGQVNGIIEVLEAVTADAWSLLEESHPHLAESLATACDDLADLLRS